MGYHDFVLRELWPFREISAEITTVAGTQEYIIDDELDEIDEQNIISVAQQGASARKLVYVPYNQLRNLEPDYDQEGQSLPKYYYIKGGNIGLWPKPSGAYTITVDYYIVPTELSADSDEPIIPLGYRESLMQYALSMEHDYNTDPDLAQKAMNRYEQIVSLARNNLLTQPNDESAFKIRGASNFDWSGMSGEVR